MQHLTPVLVSKYIFQLLFILTPIYLAASEIPVVENGIISKVKTTTIGPSQYEVTCVESPSYCAEEFKRLCPKGFNVDGYFRNEYDHGQITARIVCKMN
ncbi:MAG: hypothetical protein ACI9ZT_001834 [Gammaproteobacteria bacterium]|jgi:hypothetical protein